jgi:hypothetical protein
MSPHKLSNKGYTTIFHPENEGVTVNKKETLTITTSNPPVLQGCKEEGGKLWTVTATKNNKEEINNVYSLPLTKQSVHYLHALAGFPVESKWIKAVKAENYITWPELTAGVVHTHFPESEKNTERTHETTVSEHQINQSQIKMHQTTSMKKLTRTNHKQNSGMYTSNLSCQQHSALKSNRMLPSNAKQQKQIHHGVSQ